MKEIWKGIKNYEGKYQASNFGRIKSLGYIVYLSQGRTRRKKERILKLGVDSQGYLMVSLSKSSKRKTYNVHSLTLSTFKNKPSNYHICNHKDGDKKNNKLPNLEWVTHKQNTHHAYKTGLFIQKKMLPTKIIKKIQKEHIPYKVSSYFLAKKYNVSKTTIMRIIHSKIVKRDF